MFTKHLNSKIRPLREKKKEKTKNRVDFARRRLVRSVKRSARTGVIFFNVFLADQSVGHLKDY